MDQNSLAARVFRATYRHYLLIEKEAPLAARVAASARASALRQEALETNDDDALVSHFDACNQFDTDYPATH